MLVFYSLLLIKILVLVVFLLVSVAYFTLAERKILSSIQRRKGCNVVGIFGLLQPLADGLKLFSKEIIVPSSSNKGLFILAPFLTFLLSILGWAVIPFNENSVFVDLNLGLIYVFAISGLSVYGIFISGWSSNSRYAFLGSLRSCSQLISYEVSIGFIVLTVAAIVGSLNFSSIVLAQKDVWFCFSLFPMFILFFISMLAETNRHPFDLPEAEAELVSGYNTEYSSMAFALFFLGEYANMLLMSMFISVCFVGGWFLAGFSSSLFLSLKMAVFVVGFIWARAAFPRFRYDQLMRLGWKIFLPLSLAWLIFVTSFFIAFNWCF